MIQIESEKKLGRIILSFDLELGWGSIENGQYGPLEAAGVFQRTRGALRRLLQVLDDLEVGATWGMVGCLAEAPGQINLDHLPPPIRQSVARAIAVSRPETLDGRDLVEMIVQARAPHAFCSHTYSHFRFHHPLATQAIVERELELAARVISRNLPNTDRFIFPLNQEGYYSSVEAMGVTLCRGTDRNLRPGWVGRFRRSWCDLTGPRMSRRSRVGDRLWRVTDSVPMVTGRHPGRLWLVQHQLRRGLVRAAGGDGDLHVWTHPMDLGGQDALLEAVIEFVRAAARLRDQGRIRIERF